MPVSIAILSSGPGFNHIFSCATALSRARLIYSVLRGIYLGGVCQGGVYLGVVCLGGVSASGAVHPIACWDTPPAPREQNDRQM